MPRNAPSWRLPYEKTGPTDDERIKDIAMLPPPEHLIRFFPINGTHAETLVAATRERTRRIMRGADDRLLVVIGPCSIHDPIPSTRVPLSITSASSSIPRSEEPVSVVKKGFPVPAERITTSPASRASSARRLE